MLHVFPHNDDHRFPKLALSRECVGNPVVQALSAESPPLLPLAENPANEATRITLEIVMVVLGKGKRRKRINGGIIEDSKDRDKVGSNRGLDLQNYSKLCLQS